MSARSGGSWSRRSVLAWGAYGLMEQRLVARARADDASATPAVPRGESGFEVPAGVRRLFLDDVELESRDGLRRVVHAPDRHPANPVLRGEHPWERASATVYGTALFDPERGRFRLWYLATPGPSPSGRPWVEVGGFRRVPHCTLVAYAESTDGIRWEKPALGQLSFEGDRDNNLVRIGLDNPEGISVLHDPQDPDPRRRFKAYFWDRRVEPPGDDGSEPPGARRVPVNPPDLTPERAAGGMWVAFSPDGITWETHGPVLDRASDTTQTLLYDPRLERYVAFGRFGFGRVVARAESPDALRWSEPRVVLSADDADGPGGQIYGMPVDRYEGLYLGMCWIYREGGDARIDTQLAVSRDGIAWTRVGERQTFLANAPEGAHDDGMSRVVARYVLRDERIHLYYSMVNGPHRSARFPNPERKFPPAVGLATLRRDGFVSLTAGDAPGSVTTRPFRHPAGRLRLNADARGGRVTAALLDADGRPVPGFEESRPVREDGTRIRVEWPERALQSPVGRSVRLRLTARAARLYAWWFE